jgi:phytoene desaturase
VSVKSAIVIGSGFAGLAAASFMAKAGWHVTVLEKNRTPGGRARQLKENGFTFDMGPSWYWMPDVFERYFSLFNKSVNDYYSLERLNPSYRVYWPDDYMDVPADFNELKQLFDSIEKGSGEKLEQYLKGAAYKYDVGMNKLVHKPGLSLTEFIDWQTIKGVFKLDVFNSIKKHIAKYFSHPKLQQLMEFPVLFLGALPEDTPALYSLMNYADIKGGTWYPKAGMYSIVNGMYQLAVELGVTFHFDEAVRKIDVNNGVANTVLTDKNSYVSDVVISGADYHFTETKLLSSAWQSYSEGYWSKRVMAPSCLLYYVGLNKKLDNVLHHSLFFDVPFDKHGKEIYKTKQWPTDPLFYVNVPSVTDPLSAPTGYENLFFLIPVAAGLEGDSEEQREQYFASIVKRMEERIGQSITDSIVKGNAYGLANTLRQTAILKPSCRSKKVKNLFYTGQLTVPGPGVPPSLISGEVVAKQVIKAFK